MTHEETTKLNYAIARLMIRDAFRIGRISEGFIRKISRLTAEEISALIKEEDERELFMQIACRMLILGTLTTAQIIKYTGLTEEEIEELRVRVEIERRQLAKGPSVFPNASGLSYETTEFLKIKEKEEEQKRYEESLRNMAQPVLLSQLPDVKMDLAGMSRYAREKGVSVQDLTEEEKKQFGYEQRYGV